jgi:hypothetical protein
MNISSIVQGITSFVQNKMSIPLIPVPAIMLICSTIKRPGLSPMLIASRIITRQQDFGAPVGVNIDGSPNMMNQMFYVVADEIVNALKMEGKVEIAIPPGGITTIGTGANAGGPVVVTSNNILPVSGDGIVR